MSSSKLTTILVVLVTVLSSACSYLQNSANSNSPAAAKPVSEIESEIPFATREPETWQAEIVIKHEDSERRVTIARDKNNHFIREASVADLSLENGKRFRINFETRSFSESAAKTGNAVEDAESLHGFLTTEWLNRRTAGNFEDLGIENGLRKFRSVFESSESLIFIDEKLGVPLRQEFYSIEGEQRTLVYSVELQNVKLIAESSLFAIPEGFKKEGGR